MHVPCEVVILGAAQRDIHRITKRDVDAGIDIENAIQQVKDVGWEGATKAALIKSLQPPDNVGEVRVMGSKLRLIFFWHDEHAVRRLFVTHAVRKSGLKPRLLQKCKDEAGKRRREYLKSRGYRTS
jgi:hypothetical protein